MDVKKGILKHALLRTTLFSIKSSSTASTTDAHVSWRSQAPIFSNFRRNSVERRVGYFAIFENLIFAMTSKMVRIPMESIERVYILES